MIDATLPSPETGLPPSKADKFKFTKCKDARGHDIRGLWERNGRFYVQMEVPGKGTRRICLHDEKKQPVRTVPDAVKAKNRLSQRVENGQLPGPGVTPCFNDYVVHYLNFLETTSAKGPLTIKKERCSLNGWVRFLGTTRLNRVAEKQINEFALKRAEDGVGNRAINCDVIALSHLYRFARRENWVKVSPTESWEPLKYVAPKRSLLEDGTLERICEEAVTGRYDNGQFLADYLKLLAYSGARRQAGLSAKWTQVDWTNRQMTFFTKFDKAVVVDFNEKLEAHLTDMLDRRDENVPWIFPSPRSDAARGFFANPQKVLDKVTEKLGLTDFKLHDLRHWFISYCVMSGIDTLTIAGWVGHEDGGVLIGKIYGHLNPQHKRAAANRLSFTQQVQPVATPPKYSPRLPQAADVVPVSMADLLKLMQQAGHIPLGQSPDAIAAALAGQPSPAPRPGESNGAGVGENPATLATK